MGSWERPKRLGVGPRRPSNVIPFARRLRRLSAPPFVLYLNNQEKWRSELAGAGEFTLLSARSLSEFERCLAHEPSLVFIESQLEWLDPLEAISASTRRLGCPVILLDMSLSGMEGNSDESFVKRAFEAGLTDALAAPLDPEDLSRMAKVLLHLNSPALLK